MLDDDDKQWIVDLLASAMRALEERLTEKMRDMQTEILNGFQPYAEEIRSRERGLELRQNLLEERQAILSGRLMEIEKKLLMRPPGQ
jgi:hypothetical protein